MRRRSILLAIAVLAAGLLVASLAGASGGKKNLKSDDLTGYQENPDVSSTGTGSFKATIDDDAMTISYELEYSAIEGGAATAAHIHFGKRAVNGGVSAFLCGGGDKPACPAREGTVEGVIDAADIVGPANQGIPAGDLSEAVRSLRKGAVYANVHTATFPGGEIRGQVNVNKGRHNGHGKGRGKG